jgi:ankyrin repeat protein
LHAAQNGHEAVVKVLLWEGAEVEAVTNDGWTALHLAAQNGHDIVLKFLIQGGVEVEIAMNNG